MQKKMNRRAEKKTTQELMDAIEDALINRNYYFTTHALERSKQRLNVSDIEVIKLLNSKTKYHEAKKDCFSDDFNEWNYSVRAKSVDAEDIRIIVSFDENDMLIITVINLDE